VPPPRRRARVRPRPHRRGPSGLTAVEAPSRRRCPRPPRSDSCIATRRPCRAYRAAQLRDRGRRVPTKGQAMWG
jgi:hypothetical protein